jgi:hypothetical protein
LGQRKKIKPTGSPRPPRWYFVFIPDTLAFRANLTFSRLFWTFEKSQKFEKIENELSTVSVKIKMLR